jgi:4-amino-4-deoxy-L-arabinose transferase-like glycosyltransferase
MTAAPTIPSQISATLSTPLLAVAWLLSGILLLTAIGAPPVSRTQEARVLETARQMLGTGAHGWLIPTINGHLRLEKPPLCYWMAALAYKIAGVSETAGRIPTAILAWLTLGLTFIFASELFDDRIALASCVAMLGSYLFFRNMRLAETDAPSTLFVTLALYAIWRATNGRTIWLHLAAAATGLAIMSKGGPGAYPILFLLMFAAIERRWDLPLRFITSGAIATLLIVAAPWFIYVAATVGVRTFVYEIRTVTSGRDHWDWPTSYILALLINVAPWTGVLPLAIIDAIVKWKSDARVRFVLIWCIAILLPLCLIGNKQGHYLLPLIPPMMILIGRTLVLATQPQHRMFGWMKGVLIGTVACAIAAIGGVIYLAMQQRGRIIFIDIDVMIALAFAAIWITIIMRRRGVAAGFRTLGVISAILMPLIFGTWVGGVFRYTTRTVAAQIRGNFGDGPYVFYGENVSLPLCFNLRTAIESVQTPQALLAATQPGSIAIAETKSGAAPPPLPSQFVYKMHLQGDEQAIDLYQR